MVYGVAAFIASPIHRIGNKRNLLYWLLPQIPVKKDMSYIEPFCGSCSVIINRPPQQLEVINDLDSSLIRFMRVLQNPAQRELLLDRLRYTLYSKEEFLLAWQNRRANSFVDEIDFAWSYYVYEHQAFCGKSSTWGRQIVSKKSSHLSQWGRSCQKIVPFVDRIKYVQIENDSAVQVIQRYDNTTAIFYCDPPYLLDVRKSQEIYKHEMSHENHESLLRLLLQCQGAVCISGYSSELYNDMLASWSKTEKNVICNLGLNSPSYDDKDKDNAIRTECLWRNPRAMALFKQSILFD